MIGPVRTFAAVAALFFLCIDSAWASAAAGELIDLTTSGVGYTAIFIFAIAYAFVMAEEFTHLRKSKPVILVAGILWAMVAFVYSSHGQPEVAEAALRHNLLEYGELFLFLLVAMTYINAMQERQVFDCLKAWLVQKGFSYRKLFWITGIIAFFLSPIADNLTTALLMCAVVMAVGSDSPKFVGVSCVNIVVAANAGGAFSPFGDITTADGVATRHHRFPDVFCFVCSVGGGVCHPGRHHAFCHTSGVPAHE